MARYLTISVHVHQRCICTHHVWPRPGICAVGKLDWGVSAPKGIKDFFQACLNHQLEATVDGVSADVWCTALEHTMQMTSLWDDERRCRFERVRGKCLVVIFQDYATGETNDYQLYVLGYVNQDLRWERMGRRLLSGTWHALALARLFQAAENR
jgi:hypothetical protein